MTGVLLLSAALLLATPAADDVNQAQKLLDQGRPAEAERVLLRVTRLQSRNALAHRLLGDAYGQEHRYGRACEEYERALALDAHDGGARDGLRRARGLRGPGFFAALGEWEADSSNSKGWQAEASYGGVDRMELQGGLSYSDKYFYNRSKRFVRAQRFLSPSASVTVTLAQRIYDFPVDINPIPDSNSYHDVPAVDVEVAKELAGGVRGSVDYEYFRPTFFHAPTFHASNHKLSGEVSFPTGWSPLRLRVLAAVLRDPDPQVTVIDRAARQVTLLQYGSQTLLGGGADLDLGRASALLLVIPNSDLDHSQAYSIIAGVGGTLHGAFRGRADYIHNKYASESVFSGQTSNVATFTLSWRAPSRLELSTGYKVAHRPIRNASGPFLTLRLRP